MILNDVSKDELQEVVETSHNIKEVVRKLGYSAESGRNSWTVKKKIKEYGIDTSHFTSIHGKQRTDEEVFSYDESVTQSTVRKRVLKTNAIEYKCSICGNAGEWNGSKLTLILDHKDGDNKNHVLSNLRWVCPNCNAQLSTTGYRGINKFNEFGDKLDVPVRKKNNYCNYCVDCGKVISKKATRCNSCEEKKRKLEAKDLSPIKDELASLLLSQNMVSIGKHFGVSDNTIRNWCRKLNLPYKTNQIIKYRESRGIINGN